MWKIRRSTIKTSAFTGLLTELLAQAEKQEGITMPLSNISIFEMDPLAHSLKQTTEPLLSCT